ncbi:MAG: hypothetical protein KDD94_10505 [Calditrichaeota bacterium]|nr:hypothetical protein [Calditrichota bacterium]
MPELVLFGISFLIISVLGAAHLYLTFFTDRFHSSQETVEAMMKSVPKLTKQTTVWKAWVGFNASHSIGAIFFGFVNIYLLINYPQILREAIGIHLMNIFFFLSFIILAKFYWFKTPLNGLKISFTAYIVALLVINFSL